MKLAWTFAFVAYSKTGFPSSFRLCMNLVDLSRFDECVLWGRNEALQNRTSIVKGKYGAEFAHGFQSSLSFMWPCRSLLSGFLRPSSLSTFWSPPVNISPSDIAIAELYIIA